MKVISFIFLLLSVIPVFGQTDTVVAFYDHEGKVCPEDNAVKFSLRVKESDHYKKLMVDVMDSKVESIAYYTDAECKTFDGPYWEYYKNGRARTAGYYLQNKKINNWRTWSDDGVLTDSFFYKDGYINGVGLSWNKNGIVIDSLIFEEGGKGVSHGYWNNGSPSQRGGYIHGKKDGLWTYYYATGKKCQEVNYVADSAVSYTCYDETEIVQKNNCTYEKEANFPGGEKKWKQFLANKLSSVRLPDDYYSGKIYGQVWIQFVVDIDGSITDAKVVQSAEPSLDAIALDIIKASPKWQHAVQYNRPVKAYRKQPIMFGRVGN
jgi:TonB family protein